jgi:hypothetical protein
MNKLESARQAIWLSFTTAAVVVALPGVFAMGCGGPARSPVDEAAFIESTRCGPDVSDAALVTVLDGKAVREVGPLYSTIEADKSGAQSQLRGAVITISALPGVTAEWLDRELECHSARVTLGRATPTPDDPFFLPGSTVDIDVRPNKDGLLVGVAGFSTHDARQILERAQAFAKAKPAPPTP